MSEKTKLVGERIRLVRLSKKMQQKDVAEKIGISQAHLSNIEKGRNNITLENLLKLHEVLGCPVSSFFVDIDGKALGEAQAEEQKNPLQQQFSLEDFVQALMSLKK